MALREGVLVDGPLAGNRVFVHLFAVGFPMRHILVYERPPGTAREWARWKLWGEPPDAASYRYLLDEEDERPQARHEFREVRYSFDPQHVHRDAVVSPLVPGSTHTPRRLPTEIVFARKPLLASA